MATLFSGEITTNERTMSFKAIFGKDIKINVYKENSGVSSSKESALLNLLGAGLSDLATNNNPIDDIHCSYISNIERDQINKEYVRRNRTYGDVTIAHDILRLTTHSFLGNEEVRNEEYPTAYGMEQEIETYKETVKGSVTQIEQLKNGLRTYLSIAENYDDGSFFQLTMEADGEANVKPTAGINYRETKFDIGEVKERAIHSQIRSIQHLRKIKDIEWIDELIDDGQFRIVDTQEQMDALVPEILNDMGNAWAMRGVKKIAYYDVESTGLNVMNLPPDHPAKDDLVLHILTWVLERRDDGYPTKLKTVCIPVGMKFTENLDEVEVAQALRPVLVNKEIDVCVHNADFEMQIAHRYSEVEGELSHNEFVNWKKSLGEAKALTEEEKDFVREDIEKLKTEIKEIEDTTNPILAKMRTTPLREKADKLEASLDVKDEYSRVTNLPKNEKPYLSKVKGEDIYRINVKRDTRVLSRMVNNGALDADGVPFFRHNLEKLTRNYLKKDQLSLDDVFGNASSSEFKIYDFSLLPKEYLYYYACIDTYVLPFIEWHLERQPYMNMMQLGRSEEEAERATVEILNLYYHTDTPFTVHTAEFANYKGIGINKRELDKNKEIQEEGRDLILQFLKEITGEDIKWTSVNQVGPLFFMRYRYPVKFTTDAGAPSYNKATRKHHMQQSKTEFTSEYKDVVPIPEITEDLVDSRGNVLLEAKRINNLKAPLSYIYQEFANRQKDLTSFTSMIYERTYSIDGEWIYFPEYIGTSTDTGRASGGIMIMKKSIKELFIARRGHVLHGGDLDQAELRLMATMSGDKEEIAHFKDYRYDPHTRTGALTNGVTMDQVTGDMRNAAKVINFGDAYGMGAKAAAENIYPDLVPVPKALVLDTAMLLKEFNRAYKVKSAWLNELRATTREIGYSKTPMGRYKWFPETQDPHAEQWEIARAGRQGGNVPIQGVCADFIKDRIVQMFEIIKECNITRYFTQPLFVHDEYFCEVNVKAFENAENKVYTNEMVKEEQQFNLLWLYNLVFEQFLERGLGLDYLEDEAPMTLGVGLAETWLRGQSDVYGLPGELQEDLVHAYRNNEITDELFSNLCKDPIATVLDLIRNWWAEQTIIELEKIDVNIDEAIPQHIGDHIEDLFIKRNLKDIFPVSPKELADYGLEEDDYFTGQAIKAIKYSRGEDVEITERLQNKDEIDIDVDEDRQIFLNEEGIIDLKVYKEVRKEQERELNKAREQYNDLSAYDKLFSKSKLLTFGKVMLVEDSRTLEINLHGLVNVTLERLNAYFQRLVEDYPEDKGYEVIFYYNKNLSGLPTKTIPTGIKIPVTEIVLKELNAILDKDEEEHDKLRKAIIDGMKNVR